MPCGFSPLTNRVIVELSSALMQVRTGFSPLTNRVIVEPDRVKMIAFWGFSPLTNRVIVELYLALIQLWWGFSPLTNRVIVEPIIASKAHALCFSPLTNRVIVEHTPRKYRILGKIYEFSLKISRRAYPTFIKIHRSSTRPISLIKRTQRISKTHRGILSGFG